MTDGPDPLGKRALYWMPVEPEAGVDPVDDGATHHTRPAGRHALFSDATPAGERVRDRSTVTADDPLPPKGVLAVACSTCGAVTRVGVVEFLVLHLPVGAWLPGRTFDRWMTCPACRRHTWTSVTLAR
jgi:hypothetical protein